MPLAQTIAPVKKVNLDRIDLWQIYTPDLGRNPHKSVTWSTVKRIEFVVESNGPMYFATRCWC
jgi:hypothetical protein